VGREGVSWALLVGGMKDGVRGCTIRFALQRLDVLGTERRLGPGVTGFLLRGFERGEVCVWGGRQVTTHSSCAAACKSREETRVGTGEATREGKRR